MPALHLRRPDRRRCRPVIDMVSSTSLSSGFDQDPITTGPGSFPRPRNERRGEWAAVRGSWEGPLHFPDSTGIRRPCKFTAAIGPAGPLHGVVASLRRRAPRASALIEAAGARAEPGPARRDHLRAAPAEVLARTVRHPGSRRFGSRRVFWRARRRAPVRARLQRTPDAQVARAVRA